MHPLRPYVVPLMLACLPEFASYAHAADAVALKYEKFQLDNGLSLIVHEDDKAPVRVVLAPTAPHFKLLVTYQGCHEVDPKRCYLRHTDNLDLALPNNAANSGKETNSKVN